MAFKIGRSSEAQLVGVDPDLVQVVRRFFEVSTIDASVISGLRTAKQQAALVKAGASQTLKSAHLYGLAVDMQPYLGPGVDPYPRKGDSPALVREKLSRFVEMAQWMIFAADELDFPIQWGNDWDLDGIPTGRDPDEKGWIQDLVHFQRARNIAAAEARRLARIAARERGEVVVS